MNPLKFLYDEIDVLKDGKNGKISLVYDKVSKQVYILKERNLKSAEIYKCLQKIKSPYLPNLQLMLNHKFTRNFLKGKVKNESPAIFV